MEMMSDAINDAVDNDEAEEETEELTNQLKTTKKIAIKGIYSSDYISNGKMKSKRIRGIFISSQVTNWTHVKTESSRERKSEEEHHCCFMASDLNLNHTPVPDYAYLDDDNREDVQMLFNLNEPAAGDMEEHVYLLDLNREPEEQGEYEQASFPSTSHHHQSSFNAKTEHQGVPNGSSHHQPSKKKLSSEERVQILLWLIHRAKEGELPRGIIKAASTEFNLSRRCISKIRNTAKEQMNANQRCNVTTKYHNCGRRRILVPVAQIAELAMGDRTCIRDLADKLAIPKSTVHRMRS